MAFELTVSLDVTGRRAVVVGGGPEAVARADALLQANAEVTVLSPRPDPRLLDLAAEGRLRLEKRGWEAGDLDGVFIAYVTREDDTPAAQVWEEAQANRVLLSTLDDIPRCHFATPAVVRRGDLAITIATAGRAPALAKRLRQRLEAQIGDEYRELVEIADEVRRQLLPRDVPFAEWAQRWGHALEDLDGLAALIRNGRRAEAAGRIYAAVASTPVPTSDDQAKVSA